MSYPAYYGHKSGNFGPLPAYCHIAHAQFESVTCQRRFLEMAARSGPQRKRTLTLLINGRLPCFPRFWRGIYEPCNVYNADETGIYYRALPDGTLTFSTDSLSGSKKAKDRITALVAVNMDKHPLLLLVKVSSLVALGVPHSYQLLTPAVLMLG